MFWRKSVDHKTLCLSPFLGIHQPSGVFPTKVKITINNDGIYGETESSHSRYKWHAISHLNKIDNHLFLLVDNIIAIPISLRNFSDEKEAESLILFIEERMGNPEATP
ncbi:YcxB family protein [Pectobacterium versatile]|nr:YcxB family protein [Pectobacterium versatile]